MKKISSFIYFTIQFIFLFGQDCNLITNTNTYWTASSLAKPGYLQTVLDPDFGTHITRITGDVGTPIPSVPGKTWPNRSRHEYSKDQAWNADQTLIELKEITGVPGVFMDGQTYQVLFSRDAPNSIESRWHPTDPNIQIYVTNNTIGKWNPITNISSTLLTLNGYDSCYFGPWEGNLSEDGNWVAVYATRISDGKKVCFACDLVNQLKYPDIDLTGIVIGHVSISAGAKYIVVVGEFTPGGDQTQVYDLQGNPVGAQWSEINGRPSHYDLAIDINGDEIAVGVSKSSPDNGKVIKRRLVDGVVTPLTTGGYATHTSTRNINRKGWAIVTYMEWASGWLPYYNEIDAVRLDGQRVERICHLYAEFSWDYWAQPQGSPSPDGLRVVYASDWDAGTFPIQAYVVDFRDKVIPTFASELSNGTTLNILTNELGCSVVQLDLSQEENTTLKIYDLLGNELSVVINQKLPSGKSEFTIRGINTSGIYFLKATIGNEIITRKLLYSNL